MKSPNLNSKNQLLPGLGEQDYQRAVVEEDYQRADKGFYACYSKYWHIIESPVGKLKSFG